jgi:glycosyltransferase involved in cell wall biosynthesis
MFKGLSVSVVIPTWNEAAGIAYTLRTVPSLVDEVVVVDALSSDGTADIARANGARVFSEVRRGYGRAFKTGFNAAKGDILVSADGDGTYPLGVLPDLLDYMIQRDKVFTTCSRFPLNDPGSMRSRNVVGNRVMSAVASVLWMKKFDDVLSGMWAMRREAWVQLDCVSDSWNFSEEIKIRAREMFGTRFDEFHIRYAERMGETKLAPWRVGVENLAWLGMMRLGIDRQVKAILRPKPRRFPGDAPVESVRHVETQPEDAHPEDDTSSRPPVQ